MIRKEKVTGRKAAFLGLMLTLSMILSYIEAVIIQPVAIPGIKAGLANLTVVFLLYRYGWKEALLVNLSRIVLSLLLFGSLPGFLFSLSGALLSFAAMLIARRFDYSTPLFVSMTGGVAHNIGQLLAAMVLFSQNVLGYYMPVLLVTGLITGTVNGVLSGQLIRRIPRDE